MNLRVIFAACVIAAFGFPMMTFDAHGQKQSLKEQLTGANGVAACTAKAELPDPFVANWYVHYNCAGKPHTMRYARTDGADGPGPRVQFITGPVHASFVNAERARKPVKEDYATPKP